MDNPLPHITILYPLCPSYSGSTLLSLLLGSQQGIYGAGELFIFSKHPERIDALQEGLCSCNQKRYQDCDFWTKTNALISEKYGLTLEQLNVEAEDKETFLLHNSVLLEAISAISQNTIIVDNSKIVSRFVQLQQAGFNVIPIVLYREPQAVVHSWVKRQYDWWDVAHYYPSFYKEVVKYANTQDTLTIRYEALVKNPIEELQKILQQIDIPINSIDLNWQQQTYHHLKGNPMRFQKDSTISISNDWKNRISLRQQFWIVLLAFPVKMHRYWFYLFWERFVVLFTWKRY